MSSLPETIKFLLILAESSWKAEIKLLLLSAISHENWSLSQTIFELFSLETFFFNSHSFQTPPIVIVFRHLVTLRPFTLFWPKARIIKWQKFLKFTLLGNCFVDLFRKVEIWYPMNFKFFFRRFFRKIKKFVA